MKKSIILQGMGIILCMLVFINGSMAQQIKVMSYNIHHGADEEDQDQLLKMAAFIKQSDADIVGLQEVDSVCRRSGQIDQPKVLAEKTGMYYTYVRHFAYDGGSYGLALLSKFPIKQVQNHRIPVSTGTTTAFLTAEVEISPQKPIQVGVVHLDYRSEGGRIQQAEIVSDILGETNLPFVLTGDMNAEPNDQAIAILLQRMQSAGSPDLWTYPVSPAKKKIDYVMINQGRAFSVRKALVPKVLFSDHLPFLAFLDFKSQL